MAFPRRAQPKVSQSVCALTGVQVEAVFFFPVARGIIETYLGFLSEFPVGVPSPVTVCVSAGDQDEEDLCGRIIGEHHHR